MADYKKVIKGLDLCLSGESSVCNDCPYDVECKEAISVGPSPLRRDALELLKEQEAEQSDWISVKERKPVETHSIFWPWYGTKKWSNAMWREQSDKVLVTVEFKDGTRLVTTGETHDGVWHTAISRTLDPVVTHWMQFPELPEGVKWE